MTPEGKVKAELKAYLKSIGCVATAQAPTATTTSYTGWYFMPVGGYMSGVSGVPDFIGQYMGRFFAIETKVKGKNPTALQQHQITAINLSGGKAFVVRGEGDLGEFKEWVKSLK